MSGLKKHFVLAVAAGALLALPLWGGGGGGGDGVTGARAGEFTADATLAAHFFGALDAGEIGSFRTAACEAMAGWRVTLEAPG